MSESTATTEAPEGTALSETTLAEMDRAVRYARKQGYCTEFDRIASVTFGVPANEVVDSDGFTCGGYNREGFNSEGWNREGYNAEGFNYDGWDKEGYNKEGYDRYGLNKDGVDVNGRDKYRFDYNSYDPEGYDYSGNRRRASRAWYEKQAEKPETDFRFDANGYERPAAPVETPAKSTLKSKLGF